MFRQDPQVLAQNSVITPLVIQAVRLQNIVFFYLYPHPYSLKPDTNCKLVYSCAPWSWKLIPWLLSYTIVIGILSCGSCMCVYFVQIFGYQTKPWLRWNLFNTITTLGLNVAAILQIVFCIVMRVVNVFPAFSEMLKLEQKC